MLAVVWTDVIQLVVYLSRTAIAAVILLGEIPGGWAEVLQLPSRLENFACSTSPGT